MSMEPPVSGFTCPECGGKCRRIFETRQPAFADSHEAVRRRRECGSCGTRVTTIERVVGEATRAQSGSLVLMSRQEVLLWRVVQRMVKTVQGWKE